MKPFDKLGYWSADIEQTRQELRTRHKEDFANVEILAERALADLKEFNGTVNREHLVAVGYWLRCLECCQGAVMLIERGMPSAPFPTLRTAFECLFVACALWRRPALATKLETGHHVERIKQAKGMMAAGAGTRVAPERLADLQAVAAETPPVRAGLSAWDAADAADLKFEYENCYRGLGIAGAHASLRSLDNYFIEQPDGSMTPILQPQTKRTAWMLGLVVTCLVGGIARHREAYTTVASSARA